MDVTRNDLVKAFQEFVVILDERLKEDSEVLNDETLQVRSIVEELYEEICDATADIRETH